MPVSKSPTRTPTQAPMFKPEANGNPPAERPLVVTLLNIENFKGINAVRWEPNGTLAVVSGNNGAGKSSLLDGVMACLTSGARLPEQPIRRGYKKATCYITLGRAVVEGASPEAAYHIERSWTPSGGSIKIENADGTPITERAGDWLARMFGVGGCDPLAFAQAAPAAQRETLMRVTGVDVALAELEAQRAAALGAKRDATTAVTLHTTALAGLPDRTGPDVEVSVAELSAKVRSAHEVNGHNKNARNWLAGKQQARAAIAKQLRDLEETMAELRDSGTAIQVEIAANEAEIVAMQDIDVAGIEKAIGTVEADNAAARHRQARKAAQSRLSEAQAALIQAARSVDDIDAKRRLAIEKAAMPVNGLAFADDSVTFGGVPLAQVNTAMQIRIGVAMALTDGKPIRVVFTRYGSLLDDAGMVALRDLAAEHGAQVFVERVSGGDEGGIVITDGVAVEGGAL